MCGIVFLWDKDEGICPTKFTNAVRTLTHRGPDDTNTWFSSAGDIGIGHTRLSIVGISNGRQPIQSPDGSTVGAVNGEFYGFGKLREQLSHQGYKFKTDSDSEVALALYRLHGDACAKYLRGEFAFVIWDAQERRVFAARDRFGIKPLYYFEDERRLCIASEIKALLSLGIPREWDPHAILENDYLYLLRDDRSFFRNVKQVKPGHYLIASRNRRVSHSYWDFSYPDFGGQTKNLSDGDYIEAFRQVLFNSVSDRLKADVPVGVYLSGGLDSCSVLGAAAAMTTTKLKAFSISFDEKQYDESDVARETADHWGADLSLIRVSDSMLARHFRTTVWHCEAPMYNTHSVAKYILSSHVRKNGCKAVLTGEGSDDILGGYAFLKKDMLRYQNKGNPEATAAMLANLEKDNRLLGALFACGETPETSEVRERLGYVPAYMETGASHAEAMRELHTKEFSAWGAGRDVLLSFIGSIDEKISRLEHPNQTLYMWGKSHLPSYILLALADRVEMANSVEGRLPFLDHRLVELVTQMPDELKMRGATEKYVLREALRDHLTDTVYRRQKHPFLAPPASTATSGEIGTMLQDILHSRAMADLPFYDQAKVVSLVNNSRRESGGSGKDHDKAILQIASLCVMQEEFGLT